MLENKSNKDKCLLEEITKKSAKCKRRRQKKRNQDEIRKLKITEKAFLALFLPVCFPRL